MNTPRAYAREMSIDTDQQNARERTPSGSDLRHNDAPEPHAETHAETGLAMAARPCRVLAIDDNADIRESLAVIIRLLGHDVITAADGERGLEAGIGFAPDLVLVDVGLPGLDGYQVARLMRQEPWGRRAVLAAMTGWTRESDLEAAVAAGFDAHVAKPVDLRTLRDLITKASPSTAMITRPLQRILVVDDNVDAADSLAMLLRLLGAEVEVANSGPEALRVMPVIRPALVLLDLSMPGMDGYEVLERIRAMALIPPTQVAALTGWGQDADRQRVADAGFDKYLVKPVELATLETLLVGLAGT